VRLPRITLYADTRLNETALHARGLQTPDSRRKDLHLSLSTRVPGQRRPDHIERHPGRRHEARCAITG
jgi:hypothetical protein